MKNFLTAAFAGILGICLGLFLNDQAHRYAVWLYQAHYQVPLGAGSIAVPRFFAAPIYAALGFFSALYGLLDALNAAKRVLISFAVYLAGSALGFGLSLAVHPLFHRLSGGRATEDAFLKAYIGLDVFVCPLLIFGTAFLACRWLKRTAWN